MNLRLRSELLRLSRSAWVAFGILVIGQVQAAELPNFADLVEKNAPTIVEIATLRQVAARPPIPDSELEELLRRLNPEEEPDLNLDGIPEQRQRGAVGSGF